MSDVIVCGNFAWSNIYSYSQEASACLNAGSVEVVRYPFEFRRDRAASSAAVVAPSLMQRSVLDHLNSSHYYNDPPLVELWEEELRYLRHTLLLYP